MAEGMVATVKQLNDSLQVSLRDLTRSLPVKAVSRRSVAVEQALHALERPQPGPIPRIIHQVGVPTGGDCLSACVTL